MTNSVILNNIKSSLFFTPLEILTIAQNEQINWAKQMKFGGVRLIWVEDASCQIFINEQLQTVIHPEYALLIGAHTHITIDSLNPEKRATLVASQWLIPNWLEEQILENHQFIIVDSNELNKYPYAKEIKFLLKDPIKSSSDLKTHPLMLKMIEHIFQIGIQSLESEASQSKLVQLLTHPRIGPWIRSVLGSEGSLPSVLDAAKGCHYSLSGFTQNFQTITGLSYADFLTHWRMSWSLLRFIHQKTDVNAEAHRWGYETGAAFRKRFKSVINITPGEARKMDFLSGGFDVKNIEKLRKDKSVKNKINSGGKYQEFESEFIKNSIDPPKIQVSIFKEVKPLNALIKGIIKNL